MEKYSEEAIGRLLTVKYGFIRSSEKNVCNALETDTKTLKSEFIKVLNDNF